MVSDDVRERLVATGLRPLWERGAGWAAANYLDGDALRDLVEAVVDALLESGEVVPRATWERDLRAIPADVYDELVRLQVLEVSGLDPATVEVGHSYPIPSRGEGSR